MNFRRQLKLAYHFCFRDFREAEDFYDKSKSHVLIQLETWRPFSDWKNFDAVKVSPFVGVNVNGREVEYARLYSSFFAYEVSAHPLDVLGRYRILKSRAYELVNET